MTDNVNAYSNDEFLRVENLSQHFGGLKAVDNVSFSIKKGEVFGLVGESGCGKTTTGRAIIKLYNPTSGNVYYKGRRIGAGTLSYKTAIAEAKAAAKAEIAKLKASDDADAAEKIKAVKAKLSATVAEQKKLMAAAIDDNKNCDKKYIAERLAEAKREYNAALEKAASDEERAALKADYEAKEVEISRSKLVTEIQMIFQDPIASLDPRMTVSEIISEGLVIKGIKDKEYIAEQVYKVLETVGLVREHAGRYPHEFSGGQRQRIGVARAVIMKPEIIIADEPVSALDVSIQAQVINLLNELRDKFGLTILFIAHDLSVVKYFSDRIGVMYFGKMVELATSDALFANPLHPYTRSLLSAIPLPDPEYEKTRRRVDYNPLRDHDYSTSEPTFREVAPGHFVLCNDEEEARYKAELQGETEEQGDGE